MSTAEGVLEDRTAPAKTARTRLCDRLHRRLQSIRYPALAEIRVEGTAGRVVIRGRVRSYYHKQLAQSVALQMDGVESLTNEIVVD